MTWQWCHLHDELRLCMVCLQHLQLLPRRKRRQLPLQLRCDARHSIRHQAPTTAAAVTRPNCRCRVDAASPAWHASRVPHVQRRRGLDDEPRQRRGLLIRGLLMLLLLLLCLLQLLQLSQLLLLLPVLHQQRLVLGQLQGGRPLRGELRHGRPALDSRGLCQLAKPLQQGLLLLQGRLVGLLKRRLLRLLLGRRCLRLRLWLLRRWRRAALLRRRLQRHRRLLGLLLLHLMLLLC